MTSGRIFIYLLTAILVMSCSGENDTIVGNHGWHLNYIHRPAESLIAYHNDYLPNIIDTTCADLHIFLLKITPYPIIIYVYPYKCLSKDKVITTRCSWERR